MIGRVQPGVVIHLIPKNAFAALPDAHDPELKRVPLEEVCCSHHPFTCLDVCKVCLNIDAGDEPPRPTCTSSGVSLAEGPEDPGFSCG